MGIVLQDDIYWMQRALEVAVNAKTQNEVPVGAILVKDQTLVAQAGNACISLSDPCAHAEILVLRQYAKAIQNYRLPGTTLYVTLEPCLMCANALVHARIERLVYGASDKKTGAIDSQCQALDLPFLNHCVAHEGGILATQCSTLLGQFFQEKRFLQRGLKTVGC